MKQPRPTRSPAERVEHLKGRIEQLTASIEKRRALWARAKKRALDTPPRKLIAGWFDEWSKRVMAMASDVAALDRAIDRLPRSRDRAADAARLAVKAKRKQEFDASMARQLDRIAATAPKVDDRWARDRKQEAKRLKKRKKELAARTYKDVGGVAPSIEKPGWLRRPVKLPPPVEQPKDIEEPLLTLPDRPDLLPGTFKLIDVSRRSAGLLDQDPLPEKWTAEHVGYRLIEAHAILKYLPMKLRPAGFGSPWPEYRYEAIDVAAQTMAATLLIGRNRLHRTATSDELARTNEALDWPMQFLSHLNYWALASLSNWANDPGEEHGRDLPPAIKPMLQAIATALNAANEVVK